MEFFQGTTLLGEDTTSPYSYLWNNVSVGNYALTAKATDNQGSTTTSSAVNISVTPPNSPPTVSITSPANNASFVSGADITLEAAASDSDGSISKVEFFQGTTLLGEDTSSPYSFIWSNVSAGNYSLTAKATDNVEGTTTSAPVNITVSTSPLDPATPANEYIYLGARLLATQTSGASETQPTEAGTVIVVPPTEPNQNASVTFTGTAGQRVAYLANQVTGDPNVQVVIYMTGPGGAVIVGGFGLYATQTYFSDVRTLPSDGTYTIWVDPADWLRGGVTLTLYLVPPDLSFSTTPTQAGSVVVVPPTTVPGQNASVTFTGTAGQRVSFLANQVTGDPNVKVIVFMTGPGGVVIVGGFGLFATQSWSSGVHTLPLDGTYTIGVNPDGWLRGGITLTVYLVP